MDIIKTEIKKKIYCLKCKILNPSFLRILSYGLKYKHLVTFGNIFLIAISITGSIIPYYVGKLTDTMNGKETGESLNTITQKMLYIFIAFILLISTRDYFFDLLALNMIRDMKTELFGSLLKKDIEFYDRRNTGELLTKLTNDVERVQYSSIWDISHGIKKVIYGIFSLGAMVMISAKLTFIIFIFLPFVLVIINVSASMKKEKSREASDSISNANAVAAEALMNIRVVKAFSTEDKEKKNYVKHLDEVFKVEFNSKINTIVLDLISACFFLCGLLFLLYLGGMTLLEKSMSAGDLSSFLMYGLAFIDSVSNLEKTVERLASSVGAVEKIFEILDYTPKINDNEYKGVVRLIEGEIVAEKGEFTYPTKTENKVMHDLNFTIKKGETIGVVGSSGSGKSTLVNLIERLYELDKGEIKIDGVNIRDYNLKNLHKQIGYVSQEPSLFTGNILENVTYGVDEYTDDEVVNALLMSNANFVFDKKMFPEGLQTQVGERGVKLSGGQKQRIAIARALIKNPKILIFDEATSALDSESEHQVQKTIDQFIKSGNRTVIIIAHRLSTVINCDRILVFSNGGITEEGNHSELVKLNGVYKALIERQIAGIHK
jgi:ABC-type multidrug transport system fused ATPase/permease subunit